MVQAALAKSAKDGEGDGDVRAVTPASRTPVIGAIIYGMTAMFCAVILAGGIYYSALAIANHPAPPPPLPAPYVLIDAGSNGVVWRMNTQTGELLACRSLGPAGVMPNDPEGAGCWHVGVRK